MILLSSASLVLHFYLVASTDICPDPFDTSDPFDGGRGTPGLEASVGKAGDKIHIRELGRILSRLNGPLYGVTCGE